MKASIRKIIHIDMDCFYAAVEELDFPELRGKPVAVGGGERGVLSTANYEARRFGVRSAMPTRQALKLCPHLILRPHRFARYRDLSEQVYEIFLRHTDRVERVSLDEAYLDVSGCRDYAGSASWLAKAIKKEIFNKTGLRASAGVAPNKFLAKVASDWQKPDGLFCIAPDQVAEFVKKLPVGKINGVGKVMRENLQRWNIHTCADLQKWSREDLFREFGSSAISLYDYARGRDDRELETRSDRKSLSVENTFDRDLLEFDLYQALPELYQDLAARFDKISPELRCPIKTIFLKLKSKDFEITTVDRAYPRFPEIECFYPLLATAYQRKNKAARLLGLGLRFEEPDSLRALQQEFPT